MSEPDVLDSAAMDPLKAPFPWFGGKSKVSHLVWDRFGNIPNYVEPFAGSLAVLLNRPHAPGIETVNDIDCYLANFWRAARADPAATAEWADWPVNEADLHARHQWMVNQAEFRERMKTEPDFYDCRIAGWWVWGICQWIGGEWCDVSKSNVGDAGQRVTRQLPHLGNAGCGVHRKRPHLGNAGRGVHRKSPHLGDAGRGVHRTIPHGIYSYFDDLAARLRSVRVCCGSWERVLGETPTIKLGLTGVFLDPPYSVPGQRAKCYSHDSFDLAHDVREWAIAHGDNPKLRIALCGYDGEHEMPASWECVAWKTSGGYGSQSNGRGKANKGRERIWFSPHCLRSQSLFQEVEI